MLHNDAILYSLTWKLSGQTKCMQCIIRSDYCMTVLSISVQAGLITVDSTDSILNSVNSKLAGGFEFIVN